MFLLHALDILLTALHVAVIAFNLTGWIFKRTRKFHLIVVGLTLASWVLLGPFCGWGYCFLTDWHWDIKEKLGETNLPASFITYGANAISGNDVSPKTVDTITLLTFIGIVLITLYVNFIRPRRHQVT